MIEKLSVGPPLNLGERRGEISANQAGRKTTEGSADAFSNRLKELQFKEKMPLQNINKKPDKYVDKGTQKSAKSEGAAESATEDPVKTAEKKLPETKNKTGAQRERAIRKFMDSVESELGINPMQIVESIATLEPQKLAADPKETIDDVISSVNLEADDKIRLRDLYTNLVTDLGMTKQEKPLPLIQSDGSLMATPLVLERFQAAQAKKNDLHKSLDQLNKNFWSSNVGNQSGSPGGLSPELTQKGINGYNSLTDAFSEKQSLIGETEIPMSNIAFDPELNDQAESPILVPLASSNESAIGLNIEQPLPSSQNALAMKNATARYKNIQDDSAQAGKDLSMKNIDKNQLDFGALAASLGLSQQEVENLQKQNFEKMGGSLDMASNTQNNSNDVLSQNTMTQFDSQNGAQYSQNEAQSSLMGGEKRDSSDGKADSKQAEFIMPGILAARPESLKDMQMSKTSLMATPVDTNKDVDPNMQALLKQAQYLLKKGGGEVKVQMSPEGMGNINLLVQVKNGQVNVQMAADTQEAKKSLESALPELKNSLSAQKLSVDQVKIDVVSNVNTDSQTRQNQQDQQNMNQQNRDLRQFWNQFQENFGNRSQRDAFWEAPDLRGYRKTKEETPLQPISSNENKVKSLSPNKGRGLDLVA